MNAKVWRLDARTKAFLDHMVRAEEDADSCVALVGHWRDQDLTPRAIEVSMCEVMIQGRRS